MENSKHCDNCNIWFGTVFYFISEDIFARWAYYINSNKS
jgi:hypothetical protein